MGGGLPLTIIEALVDQAYEQMDKTNIKKTKKKSSK